MIRLITLLSFALNVSAATAQTLVSGSGVSLSTADINSDLLRVPAEVRSNTFSRPDEMQKNVANLYVRRVLAVEAQQAGAENDPAVKAALALARDRVLSDARLAQLDLASQNNPQALEAYALTKYKADPKQFATPERIKISHILILSSTPHAQERAEQLLRELKAGGDFAQLAKDSSQDQGTAKKGGDLGLVSRGSLLKPFEDAAFSLNGPGALSEVIETQFGFHIIKLEERHPASIQPFERVKNKLMKDVQANLINASRMKEQDRILAGATFDVPAIEQLAKDQLQTTTQAQ